MLLEASLKLVFGILLETFVPQTESSIGVLFLHLPHKRLGNISSNSLTEEVSSQFNFFFLQRRINMHDSNV